MKSQTKQPEFDGVLPKGLVIAKPIETMRTLPEEEQRRIWSEGIPTRKRRGCKTLAAIGRHGEPGLYTDGINRIVDASVAHLLDELASLGLPPKTVLPCEGTFGQEVDNQGHVWSILSSKRPKKVEENLAKGWRLHLSIFNALFLGGKHVNAPYSETYPWIQSLCAGRNLQYIQPVLRLGGSLEEAREQVIRENWEGMVINHESYVMTCRLDGGKVERPWGSWKDKPINESDFIVREVAYRDQEKYPGQVKEVLLSQLDPDGNEFSCGWYGGGFTVVQRKKIFSLKLPFVLQLTHDSRMESGCPENPRDPLIRPEKRLVDCVSTEFFPKAKGVRA